MTDKTQFVIYDARALSGDTDDAVVMDTADSIEEVRKLKDMHPADCAVYEYDLVGNMMENETLLGELGDV